MQPPFILHLAKCLERSEPICFFIALASLFSFQALILTFLSLLISTLSFSPFASCHFIRAAWAAVFECRTGNNFRPSLAGLILQFFVDTLYFSPSILFPFPCLIFFPFLFLAIFSGGRDPPLPLFFFLFFFPFGSHRYLLLFRLALLARPMNSCQN